MISPALRRFLPYLRPHARLLALTVVAAVVSLAAASIIPLLIKAVIDGPVAHRQPGQLLPFALAILALGSVEVVANFARRNYSVLASLRMEKAMRDDFYAHLQGLQVAFHDNWQSGQLLSRAVADIQTVRRFVGFGVVFAGFFGAQWLIVLAILLRMDWRLALISSLLALPLALLSRRFFRRYARIARQVQDQQGDMTTVVEEMATGVRIIKAFGRNALLLGRFRREAEKLRGTNLEGVRVRASTWTTFNLLINLDLCLVLLVGGFAVTRGELSIGGLVAFMTYLFMLIWPLDALGWILAMGEEATTASTRLAEVFDSRPEIVEPAAPRLLTRVRGGIRLEGVGFRYPGGGDWVLRGLDLELAPGETVALVGATGSGKTTLATLVPRLYDVAEGRVLLDGVDVRDLSLRALRGQVGMAFEDPILFSASVHENLVMGRPITSDRDLRRALQVARAEFVWDLPWGLETRVGEQGYSLSGGQRQRLALARAVLGEPRVLVLDDPLSAVDVHTEHEIEQALASVLGGVTALVVVHRPSTLALADRVALLEDGLVVELGTHSELLRSSERYRSLLAEQAEEVA
ncbi:MAG TPA: ABC transporter ATP-binding protein [Candidatus Dormibacteraeota bacterium]|nr:ABC transporter ATP-binding protein [Candidatus Dormibacteraeota bacterium]